MNDDGHGRRRVLAGLAGLATGSLAVGTAAAAPEPPTATARVDASVLTVGDTAVFTAEASDADGEVVGYEWFFDDGTRKTGRRVEKRFETVGEHPVVLQVRDDRGLYGTTQTAVDVVDVDCSFALSETVTGHAGVPDGVGREVRVYRPRGHDTEAIRFELTADDEGVDLDLYGVRGEGTPTRHDYDFAVRTPGDERLTMTDPGTVSLAVVQPDGSFPGPYYRLRAVELGTTGKRRDRSLGFDSLGSRRGRDRRCAEGAVITDTGRTTTTKPFGDKYEYTPHFGSVAEVEFEVVGQPPTVDHDLYVKVIEGGLQNLKGNHPSPDDYDVADAGEGNTATATLPGSAFDPGEDAIWFHVRPTTRHADNPLEVPEPASDAYRVETREVGTDLRDHDAGLHDYDFL